MVIGEYPCCGAALAIAAPEKTPVYFSEVCPACGVQVWHRLSRLDPESWTEDEFLARYEVHAATATIKERNPDPPAPPIPSQIVEAFFKMMENSILYGDSSGPRPTGLISAPLSPIRSKPKRAGL